MPLMSYRNDVANLCFRVTLCGKEIMGAEGYYNINMPQGAQNDMSLKVLHKIIIIDGKQYVYIRF